jgi:ferric-dicitrate binding protein FerR (iron transport regulator)
MDRKTHITLIHSVLAGEAGEAEKRELEAWTAGSGANRDEFDDLKLLWDFSIGGRRGAVAKDVRFYDGLVRIRSRFAGKLRRRRAVRFGIGLSAVALIVVGLVALFHAGTSGTPRVLEFNDVTLQKVLHSIEEEFNVVVETPEEGILACRFTGVFYGVDRAEDVMQSLSEAVNAEFIVTPSGKYRLNGKGCE